MSLFDANEKLTGGGEGMSTEFDTSSPDAAKGFQEVDSLPAVRAEQHVGRYSGERGQSSGCAELIKNGASLLEADSHFRRTTQSTHVEGV
jgi:hypothetical protein